MTWDTPVTTLLPSFKLGDADTTSRVLVKHLICACTGLPRQDFEWLFQYKGVTAEDALEDAGARCSRPRNSARCSSTRTRWPAPPDSSAATSRSPHWSSAPPTTRRWPTRVFKPLGMSVDDVRFRDGRSPATTPTSHAPDVDGKPALARDGTELLDHPAAAGRRRLEQHARHAEVRADGARRRHAARRQALHREGHAAGAARAAGADRQGRDLRHGADGQHEVRHSRRPPWRRPDRLSQRHDVAARAQRRRGRSSPTRIRGWILRTPFRRKLLEVLFDGRPRPTPTSPRRRRASSIRLRRRSEAARRFRRPPAESRSWRRTTSTRRSAISPSAATGAATCSTSASGRARSRRAATRTARSRS